MRELRPYISDANGKAGESPRTAFQVHQQLARILSSSQFSRSERLGRLLRFIVESGLSGDVTGLKESVLGREVYDRGSDFDGRVDPIVRTEVRRLRRKLIEYYQLAGLEDSVVIAIPKGAYIPVFRSRSGEIQSRIAGENIGPFRVIEKMGEGPTGVSYRVQDSSSDQEFALKLLSGDVSMNRGILRPLEADVQAAASVRDENVCLVRGFGRSGIHAYILGDYFEGQALEDRLLANQPAWEESFSISRQMLSGLAAAHRVHVRHGNLKPANILLAERGEGQEMIVKILDFGTSSLAGRTRLTPDGHSVGTATCMAPEMPSAADVRSDVWSAGAVMYKLFTGSPPTSREDVFPIRWQADVPTKYRPALASLLSRCLSPNPAQRYSDAIELSEAFANLEAYANLNAQSVQAEHAAVAEPRPSTGPAHIEMVAESGPVPSPNFLPFVAILCALVLGLFGVVRSGQPSPPIRRVAVLPVGCPPGDPECERLGRALTQSLSSHLREARFFDVVAPEVSLAWGERSPMPAQIGAKLNADQVMTATIRNSGGARQLAVQMIRVSDNAIVSTEQFDCSWRSLSEIQSQLLAEILSHAGVRSAAENRGAHYR